MTPIRVFLADDSSAFLETARHYLGKDAGIEVVGWSATTESLLTKAAKLLPDIVFMEYTLTETNGRDAVAKIKALPNAPQVVILTRYEEEPYRRSSQEMQADAFLGKSEFISQIRPVINRLIKEDQD